jgi:hypothetical protein
LFSLGSVNRTEAVTVCYDNICGIFCQKLCALVEFPMCAFFKLFTVNFYKRVVFLASDMTRGAMFDRISGINAASFDLSNVKDMTVGTDYNGFSMEDGETYIVMLYVTDENGKGFVTDPAIVVYVEKEENVGGDGEEDDEIDEELEGAFAKDLDSEFGYDDLDEDEESIDDDDDFNLDLDDSDIDDDDDEDEQLDDDDDDDLI